MDTEQLSYNMYFNHQWSENGVKQSRYLHDDEINPLAEQINQRKQLHEQIRSLKAKSKTAQTAKQRNEVASLKCTFIIKWLIISKKP